MNVPVRILLRGWYLRRWKPIILAGWMTIKHNPRGGLTQTMVGAGLITIGIMGSGRRRRSRLYRVVVPAGEDVRIRVVPVGKGAA